MLVKRSAEQTPPPPSSPLPPLHVPIERYLTFPPPPPTTATTRWRSPGSADPERCDWQNLVFFPSASSSTSTSRGGGGGGGVEKVNQEFQFGLADLHLLSALYPSPTPPPPRSEIATSSNIDLGKVRIPTRGCRIVPLRNKGR